MGSSTQSDDRLVIPNGYRVRKVTDGNNAVRFYPEVKKKTSFFKRESWEAVNPRYIGGGFYLPKAFATLNAAIIECRTTILTTECIYD